MSDSRYSHNRETTIRSKLTPFRIVLIIVIMLALCAGIFCLIKFTAPKNGGVYYLCSDNPTVKLYNYDEYGYMVSDESAVCGTKVSKTGKTETINGICYVEIKIEDNKYYVTEDNLTDSLSDTIQETE